MFRFFVSILSLCFLGAIVAGLGLLFFVYSYGEGLPDHKQLANYDPPIVSRLYAADGQLLCEYAVEKRVFVPISAIPPLVVKAFIAAEDKNFYTHPGVDFIGVMRAMATNFVNLASDKRLVGASTITQQVVKNFLLTNELSYTRKIREAILAFRIEKTFSKEKILELYLNQIYLGNSAYGVAAASLQYFNKSLDQLTVQEAAFLAALPKAPNNYQPDKHYEAALGRRNWAIDRMEEEGFIPKDLAAEAKKTELKVRKKGGIESVHADYFCEDVRRVLVENFGEDQLYKGGLAVHTTLDPALQKSAERAFNDGIVEYDRRHGWRAKPIAKLESLDDWQAALGKITAPLGLNGWELGAVLQSGNDGSRVGLKGGQTAFLPFSEMSWARKTLSGQNLGAAPKKPLDVVKPGDVIAVERIQDDPKIKKPDAKDVLVGLRQIPDVNGALVVMDPHSGRVRAMVGGFSYLQSEFNRATQAKRQTGSAIKPLVYLAGLEEGMTPATLILDAPVSLEQGPGLPAWEPGNYTGDFAGPATMRFGLEQSRNLMTIRLAKTVGMEKVTAAIERFGVAEKLPPQFAIALGAWETTLMKLTTAYAAIAGGGKMVEPILIDRIQDRRGKILYRADKRSCDICYNTPWMRQAPPALADPRPQIVDPVTNYQLISMMQGVIERGTAQRVKALGQPIAGKTGTTNDFFDSWFIGFTPDLVAGVYVGFDQPRTLGSKETGASVAAPIFIDFMADALKKHPSKPFPVPDGVQLMPVNIDTGEPGEEGYPGVILEAFRAGKDWSGNSQVIDGDVPFDPNAGSGGFFRSLFDGVY